MRRTHQFVRSIAMGDAFTAVADSRETISYNPAGLLQKDVEWQLVVPFLGMGFNDIVKNWNNASTEYDFSDESSLTDIYGERVYLEIQTFLMPSLFIPNKGFYTGLDADFWMDMQMPLESSSIPTVDLELIVQGVYDIAKAFEVWGVNVGANLKTYYRAGVDSQVGLISIAAQLENEEYQEIIDEYGGVSQNVSMDFGLLYRFDHPWNPRIGISSLDAISVAIDSDSGITYGGVDFGNAGYIYNLNSIGFAFTKEINNFDLTGSFDFHDYTFSYFPNNSYNRRVSIGFEAAYDRQPDNSHLAALQLGVRELKYPSIGAMFKVGVLEFNTAQWIENFGTEETELLDTRYMFLIAFVF